MSVGGAAPVAPADVRVKTITWHDPATLRAAAGELDGRRFMEAISEGRLPAPPMAELVGARLVFVDDGEVRFTCSPDESTYNPLGLVHGGLLCTMLDFAAGAAVHTRLPAKVGFVSVEIKVSYLRALHAGAGELTVDGKVLRMGGRVAFAEAHARLGDGELVGHATSSLAVLHR